MESGLLDRFNHTQRTKSMMVSGGMEGGREGGREREGGGGREGGRVRVH